MFCLRSDLKQRCNKQTFFSHGFNHLEDVTFKGGQMVVLRLEKTYAIRNIRDAYAEEALEMSIFMRIHAEESVKTKRNCHWPGLANDRMKKKKMKKKMKMKMNKSAMSITLVLQWDKRESTFCVILLLQT
ncbi:hypothetical protein BLOT_016237 [Blomia tropicalis]|nr:hypothetical protein BLOT_016237 [Blomia tropicalis]